MNNQFKNPLPRNNSPEPQSNEWLAGGAQPAVPGERSQGSIPPAAQKASGLGGGLFVPPWAPGAQTSVAPTFAEQETRKQPSMPGPGANPFAGPGSLPQTPEAYIQGQHGTYGAGAVVQQISPPLHNGPQSMAQGPMSFAPGGPGLGNGPQMFAPPQGPFSGAPSGPGMGFGGPASFPQQGPNSFVPGNPNSAFAGGLNVPPVPLPGTFNAPVDRPRTGGLNDARRNSPLKDPRGGKGKKKRRVPIWARVVIGVLLFFILAGGGAFAYYQVNFASSVNSIVGQNVARTKGEGDPNSPLTNGILTGPRVNILLLGSDTDQKFQGNYIAQTDIVVTIDPSTNTVGMLSIPRDFYINVPGYGMHKLDEAYGLGGVALSRATIEQDFGIKINYYAWVGLDGFIKVIDEVGGVDVDVLHPIVDDNYPDDVGKNANNPYALKRLYIAPGPQHLDGPEALEYVRSRHADLVGDFGRSVRQQQVLTALKTKLANPDIFSKLSDIAKDLQGYLKTDMQLADVLKLMNFARSLDPNKISKLTLGPPYSSSGKTPSGADVVIPNCALIVPAIQKMLDMGNSAVCNVGDSANPATPPLAYTPGPVISPTTPPLSSTASPAISPTTPPLVATPGPVIAPTTSSSAADLSSLGTLGNSLINLSGNPSDLFGVQSLLELLLMGTFESVDVF